MQLSYSLNYCLSQYATSISARARTPLDSLHGISRHRRGHWQPALHTGVSAPGCRTL